MQEPGRIAWEVKTPSIHVTSLLHLPVPPPISGKGSEEGGAFERGIQVNAGTEVADLDGYQIPITGDLVICCTENAGEVPRARHSMDLMILSEPRHSGFNPLLGTTLEGTSIVVFSINRADKNVGTGTGGGTGYQDLHI